MSLRPTFPLLIHPPICQHHAVLEALDSPGGNGCVPGGTHGRCQSQGMWVLYFYPE